METGNFNLVWRFGIRGERQGHLVW